MSHPPTEIGSVYNNRQLIIVPGEQNASRTDDGPFEHPCNLGTGLYAFDTFNWKWTQKFNPSLKEDSDNKVPPAIVKLIGGDKNGGAKVKQPLSGFDHKQLGTIFQTLNELKKYTDPNNNNPNTTGTLNTPGPGTIPPGLSPTAVPSPTGSGNKKHTGAIVGGVIGSLAFLALLLIVFFIFRKKQQRRIEVAAELANSQQQPPEVQGDMYHPGRHPLEVMGSTQIPQEMGENSNMPAELMGYYGPGGVAGVAKKDSDSELHDTALQLEEGGVPEMTQVTGYSETGYGDGGFYLDGSPAYEDAVGVVGGAQGLWSPVSPVSLPIGVERRESLASLDESVNRVKRKPAPPGYYASG